MHNKLIKNIRIYAKYIYSFISVATKKDENTY
jgi:hypothetical protein